MAVITLTAASSPALPAHATQLGEPQVLLLHGWTCRRADWRGTLDALGERYAMLAVDLPGHGEASAVVLPAWSVAALAEVVQTLMRSTTRQVLVGHSMGGAVALEAARRAPDKVAGVVLVDTFIIPYGDLTAEQAAAIEAPFHADFGAAIGELVDNSTAPALPQAARDALKVAMASADPGKMLPLWHDLLRWSPDQALVTLAQAGVPIHAINGEHIGELAQARCAPFVQARQITGAVHFPQLELPEAFHAALDEVLAALLQGEQAGSRP